MSENSTALLCEKLQAFVVLGHTCSLTETVKHLGITRQTVRRYIQALENARGVKLLTLINRRYQLTAAGQGAHRNAQELLVLLDHWISNQTPGRPSLSRTEQSSHQGDAFFSQQQPLETLWTTGEVLLQEGLSAWTEAQGWLGADAFDRLRPHLVVYRPQEQNWVCVSIGEDSAYARFVGRDFARSAIGLSVTDDPLHRYSAAAVTQAYRQTLSAGSVRYDHVVRRVPKGIDHPSKFLSYQRLLMACRFPNGQPAIAILSLASDKVDISGLPPLQRMKLAQASASVAPDCANWSIATGSQASASKQAAPPSNSAWTKTGSLPPLLYEILRSFVSLGERLSLPESVEELGVTRQTIRRHIRTLEEIKKAPLLTLKGQRYRLTEQGEDCLRESQSLLQGFSAWLRGDQSTAGSGDRLQSSSLQDRHGLDYRSQRHPLNRLWTQAPQLLQQGLLQWVSTAGRSDKLMQLPIWDHLMVFRRFEGNWLIVAIGEKAAYRSWQDSTWVRSAVGRPLTDAPTSPKMSAFLSDTYSQAHALGAPRLDHIYCKQHWRNEDTPRAVAYQRLLFPLIYPDQSTALAALPVVTNQISIDGLPAKRLQEVPAK
ncbi:helix-turn-helix domain-containing protein [Rhodovibrionaceae bacterium A322]